MKTNNIPGEDNDDRHPLADRWSEAVDYDKTRNEIGRLIHREAQKERRINRWIGYSTAASIVVIIGLFGIFRPFGPYDDNKDNSSMYAQDTLGSGEGDSSNTLVFSEEQPRKFASKASIDSETLPGILMSPNDSAVFNRSEMIRFRWRAISNQSVLRISAFPGDSIALSGVLAKLDTVYILNAHTLQPGWYQWSVEPDTLSRKFLVTK